MTFARQGKAFRIEFHDISPPFSNFQFVDSLLSNYDSCAVRRLFSLARRDNKGKTLIIEDIEPSGSAADEIREIASLYQGYQCRELKRLTFWSQPCSSLSDMERLTDADLLGYAIIKQDSIPDRHFIWHIFESVFQKYAHHHNCVPGEPTFAVRCGDQEYCLRGVMYCQQNGLNKACAQVALRSLLSRIRIDQDINYSEMNSVARKLEPSYVPGRGLSTPQIRAVLDHYGINYDDHDYLAPSQPGVKTLPYSRILYARIENGHGGLLGFELSGGQKHIIPFYGHTFNQDTWVPRASLAYFHLGEHTQYISSEEWVSSFIGHDDNFGSNYCVPRKCLEPEQVKYVVALRPSDTAYGAIPAEAIAVDCLYSTAEALKKNDNYWIKHLIHHILAQDVVLRTVYLNRHQYVKHLRESRDWQGCTEDSNILDVFASCLPEHLWMIEVSVPEIFPANYRKIGDMILDAQISLSPYPPKEPLWVLARFPSVYLINKSPVLGSQPIFLPLESEMKSHVPLYCGLCL